MKRMCDSVGGALRAVILEKTFTNFNWRYTDFYFKTDGIYSRVSCERNSNTDYNNGLYVTRQYYGIRQSQRNESTVYTKRLELGYGNHDVVFYNALTFFHYQQFLVWCI